MTKEPTDSEKPGLTKSSVETTRRRKKLINTFLEQLAAIFVVEMKPETMALYVEVLSDLTEKQIEHGFREAARVFKPEFGRKLPAPAEIREWAEKLGTVPQDWTEEEVKKARLTMKKARGE